MSESNSYGSAFRDAQAPDEALARAAGVAVKEALAVAEGEKVLIITNPSREVFEISRAVFDAAKDSGALPTMIVQTPKRQSDYAEEAAIAAFQSSPDVVISLSAMKMGKDRAGIASPYQEGERSFDHVFHLQLYGKKTTRAFWSPAVTGEIFRRTVPIDYGILRRRCAAVKAILDEAESIRVRAPGGTDVRFSVAGRKAFADDGDFSRPGSGGNLPAGETFVSPALGSASGRIVFDGSISLNDRDIVTVNPIETMVAEGYFVSIQGGEEARALLETVTEAERRALSMDESGQLARGKGEAYARNARNLGEFGLGLNPRARISGNMLEDEKAMGTCHFAIGLNYDGDAPSLIHLDGLVRSPTVTAIMKDGSERVIEEGGELVE
jgi:leucyl aminopeptidase (aminopeptidase T)